MAIENAKTLNVRIKNKYDSYENWAASGLVLEAGEIAIAYTTVDVKVDNGTAKHPALLMKVGDGEKTFANLPWLSAKAADVVAACKSEAALTEFVNTVIGNAGIATDEAMQALSGRVKTVEDDLNTAETGLKAQVTTAKAAIEALEGLVGEDSVANQINAKIAALNLADTYAAKIHKHEIADINGLSDSIAAAKKAGDDAAEALETYKTLNDAAVKVNSDAITAMKKDATITTFKGIEDVLAGKQAAGDYSVVGHKHEIADVNGLSDSIADAKKAGTDAAGVAAANATAIEELQSKVGESSVEYQINTKISDLDLPNTYDAKGAAAQALTDAKAYTDEKDSAMNTRVLALEAIDHDHANADELAKIVDGDVAKWNAAEQNAKDYADDLDEAMDVRVKALEEKFTGDDSVAGQIEAAVAAEAKARDDADKALQALIEDNDAEILALQGLVGETSVESRVNAEKERAMAAEKVNADAIAVLNGNSSVEGSVDKKVADAINTFATQISDDNTVNTFKELIEYAATHDGEFAELVGEVDANTKAIATLNGDASTAGSVDKKIADAIAAENLDQYATDTELSALADRVGTVESDLNAETTGLKAKVAVAEGAIEALESKVGESSVQDQIDAALKVEKDGSKVEKYALATDLAATNTEVAKKANDDDLAAIAKTGSTDDLIQGAMTLVFDCGGASV